MNPNSPYTPTKFDFAMQQIHVLLAQNFSQAEKLAQLQTEVDALKAARMTQRIADDEQAPL